MSKYNRKKLNKHPQTLRQQLYSLWKMPAINTLLNKVVPSIYGDKTIPVLYKDHPEKNHLAYHIEHINGSVRYPSPYPKEPLYPQHARVSANVNHVKGKAKAIIHGGSKGLVHNY